MEIIPGSQVLVLALNKHGIVQRIDKKGIFQVQIGDLTIRCQKDEVKYIGPGKQKDHISKVTVQATPQRSGRLSAIDLHGMTVAEALSVVEKTIDRAILADVDQIEIIHGIGSGRIKDAVHKFLKNTNVVRSFSPHMLNPGITIVYL